MKKYAPHLILAVFLALISYQSAVQAGIIPAIIPAGAPTANKRGNSNVFALASNNTAGSTGQVPCDDGSGNLTYSGCFGTAWQKFAITTSGGDWKVNGADPPGGTVALAANSGPQAVNLLALGANTIVQQVIIKNVAAWTSATGATLTVGSDTSPGNATSFLPAFDPTQTASNTWYGISSGPYSATLGTQNMQFVLTLSSGNISGMTASNAATIWVSLSVLP
jgi:hypothetical protein